MVVVTARKFQFDRKFQNRAKEDGIKWLMEFISGYGFVIPLVFSVINFGVILFLWRRFKESLEVQKGINQAILQELHEWKKHRVRNCN